MDLAAEPARTALAVVERDAGGARIAELVCGAEDDVVLAALADADKAGIDCPLGWPRRWSPFSPITRPDMSPSRVA